MSQFTNWLIETHPEYIKGSRILEQSGDKKDQGAQTYKIMLPADFKKALQGTYGPEGKQESWKLSAEAVAASYRPIENKEFNLTAEDRKVLRDAFEGGDEWTDAQINDIVSKARKYWTEPASTFAPWSGLQMEASRRKNAMYYMMKAFDWEWQYVTGSQGDYFADLTVAVLVTNKLAPREIEREKKEKAASSSTTPAPGATDTIPPPLPPTPPPPPGPGAPGGAAPGGAAPGGADPTKGLNREDYEKRMAELKKTQDAFAKLTAEIENERKMELVRRKKEERARAAAGGAGAGAGAGAVGAGAVGAGRGGDGGAGAGGGGAGGGGAAPGAFSPDDIFGKEPEKVNPQRIQLEPYHLKNRKGISDTMTKVVNHFSDLGLDVYSRGGKLFVLDDAVTDPNPNKALLYNGLIDNPNTASESPIWKQLWKASLQPNIRMRLNGKDLQQILREMGSKWLDNFDNPDDMKTADPYRGKRQVYDPNYLDRDSSARFHNKSGN
jgi:hypothetical protein